jgi:hypothetical protein
VSDAGADQLGVRMVEVAQDCERVPPRIACLTRLIVGGIGITKMSQDFGLVVPVAKRPEQGKRLLECFCGLAVPTQVVLGVADAVVGARCTGGVGELLVQCECLLAAFQGLLILTELSMTPAKVVECHCAPGAVICGTIQLDCLLAVKERLLIPGHAMEGGAYGEVHVATAAVVAGLAEQLECRAKVTERVLIGTQPGADLTKAQVYQGLGRLPPGRQRAVALATGCHGSTARHAVTKLAGHRQRIPDVQAGGSEIQVAP